MGFVSKGEWNVGLKWGEERERGASSLDFGILKLRESWELLAREKQKKKGKKRE